MIFFQSDVLDLNHFFFIYNVGGGYLRLIIFNFK